MTAFVLPFPVIDPILVNIGPFAIRWYALAYVAGLLLGWFYIRRLIGNEKLWGGAPAATPVQIDDILFWITLGVVLGGRFGYVMFYNPAFFLSHPMEILAVWRGGMSFHGGFLGVIVAIWLYCRRHNLSMLSMLDLAGAAVTIGLFFGRIANFLNAELFGRVSEVPWAIIFPGGGPNPRHPSQLYEAGLEGFLLFCILRFLTHRKLALKKPGLVAGTFTLGYGLSRIIVEFFRMPDAHIGFLSGGLTMGMLLSIPMIIVGAILIVNARRKPAPQTS